MIQRITTLTFALLLLLSCISCQGNPSSLPDEQVETRADFTDEPTLQVVRAVLINHMNQFEGIEIPGADQWEPRYVEEAGELRTYHFGSGEWQMSIVEPSGESVDLVYRVQITGRDSFSYGADIRPDGTVSPWQ